MLDRTEMDHFATLFVAYQKRGKSEDQDGEIDSQGFISLACIRLQVCYTRNRQIERTTCPVDKPASTWTTAGEL